MNFQFLSFSPGGNLRFKNGRFAWKQLEPAPVIGVDEAGRGCLFGRVYAAAVIFNSDRDLKHYRDSKLISEVRREELYESIVTNHQASIGFAEVEEIESLNILWAAMLAMKRAVFGLGVSQGHVLVDGNVRIPDLVPFEQTTLVSGDQRAKPVAAASIVAKVSRDRYVREMAKTFPGYGLEKHKGYSTKDHWQALQEKGPTKLHRKGFAKIGEHWT